MSRKKTTAYVFLDTNIFLQFQYFNQVDWTRELGYEQVCLLIAPIIFSELESFKCDRNSPRCRDRSRKVSQHLEQIASSSTLGQPAPILGHPGVTMQVLTDSPNVSSYLGLQPGVQDDQLLASILEFKGSHSDIAPDHVLLVTDDSGLLLKARARSIVTARLDDRLKLPDEPTKEQQELRRIETELAELRKRQPALKLVFSHDGQAVDLLAVDLLIIEDLSEARIEELCQAEAQATEWKPPRRRSVDRAGTESQQTNQAPPHMADVMRAADEARRLIESMASPFNEAIPQKEIDRFEEERKAYIVAYRTYLGESLRHHQVRRLSQRIDMVINNDGTQPALGVKVQVIVPDGLGVHSGERWARDPRRPERPTRPMTSFQRTLASVQDSSSLALSPAIFDARLRDIKPVDPNQTGPSITPYNSTLVEWDRTKVMHGLSLALTPLVLTFPADFDNQTYMLHYRLYADNLVRPAEGMLRIETRGTVAPYQPPPAIE